VAFHLPGKGEIVTVYPQRSDIEADLAEGCRTGGPPVVETIAGILPGSLIRAVIRSHQSNKLISNIIQTDFRYDIVKIKYVLS